MASSEPPFSVITPKVIVSPSATGLSLASSTVASIRLVLVPSATSVPGVAFMVTVAGDPAINVTAIELFTPPVVAVTEAIPRLVAEYR